MSDLVIFICSRRGHVYARVVQNGPTRELVIDRTPYLDVGVRPGTVRQKRAHTGLRLTIAEPGTESEHWSMAVL
jgi:hypothetical protein